MYQMYASLGEKYAFWGVLMPLALVKGGVNTRDHLERLGAKAGSEHGSISSD